MAVIARFDRAIQKKMQWISRLRQGMTHKNSVWTNNRYIIICLCVLCFINCTKVIANTEQPLRGEKDSEINWRLIGPGDADQVSALTVSKGGIVYVSTDIGGVYKSSDWGESWMPINQGIKNYDIVTSVIISTDNEEILYIGTRGGMFKSINGGETWEAKWKGIGNGKPALSDLSACIGAVALDPVNPATVYAGMGYRPSSEGSTVVKRIKWSGNIYKSNDRGENWQIISSLGENIMIRHILLVTSDVIYIATNVGLFKSIDAGRTWMNIFSMSAKHIAAHPQKPDILYLAAGERGVFKSLDAGNQWKENNNGLSMKSGDSDHSDNYTQILVDNKKSDTIYALSTTWGGGGGVYKSLDGGNSWDKITRWKEAIKLPLERESNVETAWLKYSRRVNAIAVDPQDNDRLFIGTSRYIYKTEDGGISWHQLISKQVSEYTWTHRGINIFGHTRVVGIDPIDTNRLYIGTVDHGLVKSEDGGSSWKEAMQGMLYTVNIYDIAVNNKNSSVLYVINGKGGFKEAGVAKSHNYGETWEQMDNGLLKTMYHTIVLNPDNPDVIYVGGEGAVFMSVDGGEKWMLKNRGMENTIVHKLLFNPVSKGTIFAATDRGLFETVDGGNSWHKTHLSDMNLYTVVVDQDKDAIYVGAVQDWSRRLEGGVFKSLNGGKSWEKALNVMRIESMALIPSQPSIIYAVSNDFQYHDESSGEGIFRSIDGGVTWKSVNTGLPVLKGFNINIAPYPPYRLYLSSNGSGVYVATEPAVAVNIQ